MGVAGWIAAGPGGVGVGAGVGQAQGERQQQEEGRVLFGCASFSVPVSLSTIRSAFLQAARHDLAFSVAAVL